MYRIMPNGKVRPLRVLPKVSSKPKSFLAMMVKYGFFENLIKQLTSSEQRLSKHFQQIREQKAMASNISIG